MQQGFDFHAVIKYLIINSYAIISALFPSETLNIPDFKKQGSLPHRLSQLCLIPPINTALNITSIFTEVKITILMQY